MSNNGTLVRNLTRGGSGGSGGSSNIPFSIKSANIGDKGEVDLFNISKFVNSGCSFTGLVATGGSEKYVRLFETAPISTADSWEFKTKYYYNGGGTDATILGCSGRNVQVPLLYVPNNEVKLFMSSDGNSWNLFNDVSMELTLTATNTYYFKLSYDSVNGYAFAHSADGVSYTTSWTSATTTKCFCGSPFAFLNNTINLTAYYSSGEMDLSLTAFTIDGSVWWNGADLSNSLTFKVDDGTSYAPLKVINPSGEEVTLTSITALDLSGFSDGIINIFATATGAEARQNKIFMQTAEPTAENDGDVWINGNVVKDWDDSESEYVTSTTIAFLGSVVKNTFIENGFNPPLNYNGQIEMSCLSYISNTLIYDIYIKTNFKFYLVCSSQITSNNDDSIPNLYPLPISMYDLLYFPVASSNAKNIFAGAKPYTRDLVQIWLATNTIATYHLEGYITK